MKKLLFIFMLGCSCLFAQDGAGTHGGDGWLDENNKPWLYDFKEGGIYKNPYFNLNLIPDPQILSIINDSIPFMSQKSANLLSIKLQEIQLVYPELFEVLLVTMEKFIWSPIDKLIDIKDEDPILDVLPSKQVQLAGRKLKEIFIDINWWNKLNPENSVGLIFHELIFSMIIPQKVVTSDQTYYFQSSSFARSINRYIFSKNFQKRGKAGFKDYANSLNFPDFNNASFFRASRINSEKGFTYGESMLGLRICVSSYQSSIGYCLSGDIDSATKRFDLLNDNIKWNDPWGNHNFAEIIKLSCETTFSEDKIFIGFNAEVKLTRNFLELQKLAGKNNSTFFWSGARFSSLHSTDNFRESFISHSNCEFDLRSRIDEVINNYRNQLIEKGYRF